MPGVKIKDNEPFELALKKFKKQCEKAGILSEVRKREHFEKPSIKRKKKAIAARKRALKKTAQDGRLTTIFTRSRLHDAQGPAQRINEDSHEGAG